MCGCGLWFILGIGFLCVAGVFIGAIGYETGRRSRG
jgi:hypothetical protein